MPNLLRWRVLALAVFVLFALPANHAVAQCVGLPTVTSLSSSKDPKNLCSPVRADLSYGVAFISNVPNGAIDIVIDWGDGTTQIIPQTSGARNYSAAVSHNFPVDSDCEFLVTMAIRYNGVICPTTRQIQKVASFRTDEFNGGDVRLISPVTGTNEHLVCEGQDVSVIFQDLTNFNCNANYVHTAPEPIETPNVEHRWQQIIYNTVGTGLIPNVSVNGVPATTPARTRVTPNLQDPRGVLYMPSPVVLNDPRRRNSLAITAPGGFGPAFPQVGEVFEVRIRYWNYCNPYSNNENNPMVPVNGDVVNGDNPPIERTAIVRIVDAPPAPTAGNQTVCNGTTPGNFQVNGVPAGNLVNFYRDNSGVPGALIRPPSTSTSLPVNQHPDWAGNTVGREYYVWASYRPNVVGSCESPRIRIARIVRERATVPDPVVAPPAEICNVDAANSPSQFTIEMPAGSPASGTPGGATQFVWNTSLPAGITLASNTASTATYNVNVTFAPGELFADRTITISRRYTSNPQCSQNRSFTVRVYNTSVGGTPSAVPDVCETSPVGTITLSGHRGEIIRWETSLNGGPFSTYTGPASGNSITPGLMSSDGTWRFRAVVKNGPCNEVNSAERTVVVFDNPAQAQAGPDLAYCESVFPASTPVGLGGNSPGAGTGQWSVVSVFPPGGVATFANSAQPNTTLNVDRAAAYTVRWTVTNGSCVSSEDVVVDFGGTPGVPDPGPDKSVCGTTTTLDGVTPPFGSGRWSVASSPPGGTLTIASDETNNSLVELGATPVFGTYTLQWTVTSGSCPSNNNTVDITFFAPPVANAADIGPVCIGPGPVFTPIAVSGTIGGGAIDATWASVSGNGTVAGTTLNGANYESTYTPTDDDYISGAAIRVKLIATPAAGSPCTPDEQVINIGVDRKPLANPGADIPNICTDEVQLNAENPPPFGATGAWSTAAAVTFDNPAQPNTFVRGLPVGATQVTWTLTSASGLCVSDPVSITLTRVALPSPAPITAAECEVVPPGGPVVTSIVLSSYESSFSGIPPAGSRDITWYRNAPPPIGTVVTSPGIAQNNIPDGQVFVARIRDLSTGCSADGQLTITVRPLPTAQDAIVSICETDPVNAPGVATNVDLSATAFTNPVTGGSSGITVRWFDSFADAQAETNEILTPVTVNTSRIVHARVVYNNTPLCPDFAEVELRVNSIPNVSEIAGDPSVCMGASGQDIGTLPISTYQVPSIPGARYNWTIPQGAGEFALFGGGGQNDFFALLKFPYASPAPDLTIQVQIEFNGCSTPVIQLPIARTALPAAPVIDGDIVVCENSQAVEFNVVSPDAGADYNWEIRRQSDDTPGGAFIASGQATATMRANFLAEDVVIYVREENGSNGECVGPAASHTVAVNRLPVMANQPWIVCSGLPSAIQLAEAGTSPVTIDYFNLASTVVENGLATITAAPAPGNGPGNMLAASAYKNTTEVPLRVTHLVYPVSEETVSGVTLPCFGAPQTVVLDVNPEPVLQPGLGKAICSEEELGIQLQTASNSYPADRYIITDIQQQTPATPLTRVGAAPPLNTQVMANAIFNEAWINPGAPAQSGSSPYQITYLVAAVNTTTGCQGSPAVPVTVRVFPKPELTSLTLDRCNGPANALVEALNVADAQTSFTWGIQSISANISGATAQSTPVSGNSVTIADNLTNSSSAGPGTVVYNVRADFSPNPTLTCSRSTAVTINVGPLPAVTALPETSLCSDAANNGLRRTVDLVALQNSFAPAGTTVQWFLSDPANAGAPVVPTPASHTMENNIPVFARVTNGDAFGCSVTVPVEYTISNAVDLQPLQVKNVSCNGANNGEITALVQAGTGTAPFFFRKNTDPSNPADAATPEQYRFIGLAPGQTYTIEVQDSRGCKASLTSPVIIEPIALAMTLAPTQVSCAADPTGSGLDRNGAIAVNASGGSGAYIYSLFPGNLAPSTVNGATATFANLRPGSYTIRVTDADPSTSGTCKAETSEVINVPTVVEITSITSKPISCNGAANGEVTVTAQGGAAPYTFTLNALTQASQASPYTFDLLPKGTYIARVTDQNGCVSIPLTESIQDVAAVIAGQIGSDADLCLVGGNADPLTELVPTFGGSGAYEYEWEFSTDPNPDPLAKTWTVIPGATGTTYDPDANASPFTSTAAYYFRRKVRSVLPAGLDDVPAFCSDYQGLNDVVTITVRPQPSFNVIPVGQPCKGSTAFVKLQMQGGTPPMSFAFQDGAISFPNETGGMESRAYELQNMQGPRTVVFSNMRDAFGCAPAIDPLTEIITPLTPDATFTENGPQCAGSPFTFTVTNPDPAVAFYRWSLGDGTVISTTMSDPNNPAAPDITHTYNPGASLQSDATFRVTLEAVINGECSATEQRIVTVRRALVTNVFEPPSSICSGETVTFNDNSTGVTGGRWYWVDQDGNRSADVPAGPRQIAFTLDNASPHNPLRYQIFYEPVGNPACPVPPVQMNDILVYSTAVAGVSANPVNPPVVGGLVTTTLTNTSTAPDLSHFIRDWDLDDAIDNNPGNPDVKTISFQDEAAHDVVLTMVNRLNSNCKSSATITISPVSGVPNLDFTVTRAGCYPITLDVDNTSTSILQFRWTLESPNGTREESTLRDPDFRLTEPGVYTLTLEGTRNNVSFGPIERVIEVFDVPVADFDLRSVQTFVGEEVKPVNRSRYAEKYFWDFGDGFTSTDEEPRHVYTLEGRDSITLVAYVDHGMFDVDDNPATPDVNVSCGDTLRLPIVIVAGGALKIPNAFTPDVNGPNGGVSNGNFTNDVFLPIMEGVQEFTMHIFDRWGNLLFESRDKNIGWDGYDRNGRLMPAGVYVYKVVLRLGDGQRTTKVGDVTLIR